MRNTLQFLLEKHGITVSDFAEIIGVSRQTIHRIIRGYSPSLELSLKIAAFFKKDVSDIFFNSSVKQIAQELKKKDKEVM